MGGNRAQLLAEAQALARTVRTRDWWLCTLAFAVTQLSTVLLNQSVFPLFAGVLLEARDISTAVAFVVQLALYLLSASHPRLFSPQVLLTTALVLIAAGVPLMLLAVLIGSAPLLVTSAVLRALGTVWTGTMAYLALVSLMRSSGRVATFSSLLVGWVLCYLGEAALLGAPTGACLTVFTLCLVAVPALAWRGSLPLVELTRRAEPEMDLRVTSPSSFVPLSHALFVTIIVLKSSFGFAMTFASAEDATPQMTALACVPVLCVLLALGLSRRMSLNALYRATLLCVLAGFLLVYPAVGDVTDVPQTANVVLRAGGDLTRTLAFMLVATVGARNPVGALGVALYVSAANSFGSMFGAWLGMAANSVAAADPGMLALLLGGIIFALVAYNVLSPDCFRLDEAADALVEVAPIAPRPDGAGGADGAGRASGVDGSPDDGADAGGIASARDIDVASAEVARERGLTPREVETLTLLARGHSTQAIQDRMVISRGTAKTHIRNVYAKLGVHSQQELIELVEGRLGE
ncbi:MAG: helix-turn-helix transcriptional regulator [Coriobacteriales bacterium]|jgi:DNA-binding CsgD family transcriptional regulator